MKNILEKRIELETLAYSGKLRLFADDLKGNVIDINADEKFKCGSCAKIFVLGVLFKQIENGNININQKIIDETCNVLGSGIIKFLSKDFEIKIIDLATLMIIVSDNIATVTLQKLLGINNINNFIKSLGLENTTYKGIFPKKDNELYHIGTTTTKEMCKFYRFLLEGKIFSKYTNEVVLNILKKQNFSLMLKKELSPYIDYYAFYNESEKINNDFIKYIASKDGEVQGIRCDRGIISTVYGDYIICMCVENSCDPFYSYSQDVYNQYSKISKLIFDQFIALQGKFY